MKRKIIGSSVVLMMVFSLNLFANKPLTFEERVKAQEAIEKVYYNHRIWPKENPQPKPAFEKMVTKEQIEAKVTDYLKKSAALEKYWYRPIEANQLQAEMDRMAKGTKDPQTLNELFKALNDDPYLIAECLARPVLADRLIHNWYANDERFHRETREKAEKTKAFLTTENFCEATEAQYSKMTYKLEIPGQEENERQTREDRSIKLSDKEFAKMLTEISEKGKISGVIEKDDCFVILSTIMKNEVEMEIESLSFAKLSVDEFLKKEKAKNTPMQAETTKAYYMPVTKEEGCFDEWETTCLAVPNPRARHQAVWTGTEMIAWGGFEVNFSSIYSRAGGRYNPATNAWIATSTGNAPSGREWFSAVWTGTEMIVWGGYNSESMNSGGRYNPLSDSWIETTTIGAPLSRLAHTAVWTGSEMIVWGGWYGGVQPSNSGGRYNPLADSWIATSTTGAPLERANQTAIWTGTEMIVWGGYNGQNGVLYLNTGGRYNPSTESWTLISTSDEPFGNRIGHTAVWNGSVMIIWGGYNGNSRLSTGYLYNPIDNSWTETSAINAPSPRMTHTAVWTGTEMIVWGGSNYNNTGARYDPSTNSWIAISNVNAPSGRELHTAVWVGNEMIVWGGETNTGNTNTGGRYNPSSDTWIPTPSLESPSARSGHTAVWTGTEMIIWGGQGSASGGRYSPAIDSWTGVSTNEAPSGRFYSTAVWTGTEMIVWGGFVNHVGEVDTGGRYDPSNDTWQPTSTGTNVPIARYNHCAVWSGSEMIIWGGQMNATPYETNTGGKYDSLHDTWSPTSLVNCPEASYSHPAVWTGTEMIVWGGWNYWTPNTGGRYTPSSDTWTAVSTVNAPSAIESNTAVWTGTEMIVWGGWNSGPSMLNSGGLYNPQSDTWTNTSTIGAPDGRSGHTAVWTGSEMIVWGGSNDVAPLLSSGGRYNPLYDTWVSTATNNAPPRRVGHTAVWTGDRMVIWGGDGYDFALLSGGVYDLGSMVPPSIIGSSTNPCPSTSLSLSVPSIYSSYLWNLNGNPISGATFNNYVATVTGNYTVSVTDSIGCSETSETHAVTFIPCMENNSAMDIDSCGDSGVLIQWTAPTSWGDDGTGTRTFEVLREELPIASGLSESTLSYVDNAGDNGVSYLYQVRANNGIGNSATTDGATTMDFVCFWNIIYLIHGDFTEVTGDGDEYIEKGEKWSVPVVLYNEGNAPATNVQAVLSGNGMIVCNTPGYFGTISAWGDAICNYEFLVNTDFAPCGSDILFNLTEKTCTEKNQAGNNEYGIFSTTIGQFGSGVPTDLVIQPSTADSYVYQQTATTNYGTGTLMYAQARTGQARRSLVQFDISSIPSGSTINSATLELYATAVSGSQTLNVHRITGTWTETGVTWNTMPTLTSTADASIAGGTGAGWRIWDVLPVVQGWANGTNTNYGFIVKCNLETGLTAITYTFATKEYATTSLRPILRINYTPATSWNCDYVGSGVCSVPLPGEAAPGDTYENGQMWSEDKNTQSWPALAGATGYKLYRGVQSGLPNLLTADNDSCLRYNGANTSINISSDDPSLETGSFYWYLVVGTNGSGDGPAGNARIVNSGGSCP
jgi:N-acetylneuraminic acid mutarotase